MNHDAVSPVVGVMLMLVVTIIIAAVVSAFGGGIVKSSDTAPQASISGIFSQSEGLTFYHEGGDTLSVTDIQVTIRPYNAMGTKYAVYEVNKSIIGNMEGTAFWNFSTWKYYHTSQPIVSNFQPGDVAHVSYENHDLLQRRPDGTNDYFYKSWGLGSSQMLGSYFDLEIVDSKGRLVASTKVRVNP